MKAETASGVAVGVDVGGGAVVVSGGVGVLLHRHLRLRLRRLLRPPRRVWTQKRVKQTRCRISCCL